LGKDGDSTELIFGKNGDLMEQIIGKTAIRRIFIAPKISSAWIKKYLGQNWVSTLITAGLKYAWVGSCLGPLSRL